MSSTYKPGLEGTKYTSAKCILKPKCNDQSLPLKANFIQGLIPRGVVRSKSPPGDGKNLTARMKTKGNFMFECKKNYVGEPVEDAGVLDRLQRVAQLSAGDGRPVLLQLTRRHRIFALHGPALGLVHFHAKDELQGEQLLRILN